MKKTIFLLVAIVLLFASGASLNVVRNAWNSPEAITDANDTLLTDANDTMTDVNVPSTAYKPNSSHNNLEVCWTMAADAQECVVYLFAARKSGDIVLVYTATLTAGKQLSGDDRRYVDTLASATENWGLDITEIDKGGSDRMSRILFDTCGYQYFFCQYAGLSSESVKAYYSGY